MGTGIKGPYINTKGSLKTNETKTEDLPLAQMPNYQNAVTPIEKFSKYSLDSSNKNNDGKAEAYERGLGFNQNSTEELRKAIHDKITSGEISPYEIERFQYGVKYKFRVPVTGPNGKTKYVIAVYQIDNGEVTPRMVTNYLDKERKQK